MDEIDVFLLLLCYGERKPEGINPEEFEDLCFLVCLSFLSFSCFGLLVTAGAKLS